MEAINAWVTLSRMNDEHFMQLALAQAELAAAQGEVPVGAVVVHQGQVVAQAHNAPISLNDPTAHAEVLALRAAAQRLGNYRLEDCTLYVTLEPCAMCAGAMLNARLPRVVWGATEPKTGAAGSVVDLFANTQLNHHTQHSGGVLATQASQLMQDFFKTQRTLHKHHTPTPLRDDALRTPGACFADIPDYPWQPHYLSDLPSLNGLRMHYLDEGPKDAKVIWLCLHGNPAWSYLYRKMMPVFLQAGHRVVAPDMPGFGKSDKPKKDRAHSFGWHRQVLLEFVEALNLQHIHLAVQDWGGILGLTLPMAAPERYQGLLVMNTTLATAQQALSPGFLAWRQMCADKPLFDVGRLFGRGNPHMSEAECAAYNAPFPDAGHRAALRAFPPMVPEFEYSEGADISRQAQTFWQHEWTGKSFMAIGAQDPVLGVEVMQALRQSIRHCPEPMVLPQAGHFVQEHGEVIAQAAIKALTADTL
jgi:tRNA(adenine34) deaminase